MLKSLSAYASLFVLNMIFFSAMILTDSNVVHNIAPQSVIRYEPIVSNQSQLHYSNNVVQPHQQVADDNKFYEQFYRY